MSGPCQIMRWRIMRTLIGLLALAIGCTGSAFAAAPIGIDIDVVPSASTTGFLSIQRVELTFDNGLSQTDVAINSKLRAHAAIRYTGNGSLVGYWMVDGRPLQTFIRSLTFGNSITLDTTDLPPLPTLEPGEHEVTLQFSSPAVAFTPPVIRYTVRSSTTGPTLSLVQPAEGLTLTLPRRDGLMVSAGQLGTRNAANAVVFGWQPPVLVPGGLSPRGAVAGYRFTLFPANDAEHPLVTAVVTEPWYALPTALTTTLPRGSTLYWSVQAVNARGIVVAASEQRSVIFRSATSIELVTPANGDAVAPRQNLSWRSTRSFARYEVRGYLNMTSLVNDFAAAARPSRQTTTGGNSVFSVSTDAATIALPPIDQNVAEPGLVLYWVVVGRDRSGAIQDLSEVGSFHLEPNVASLNGLPASLLMAGFEILVDSYQLDTPPGIYSGTGNIQFARDSSNQQIILPFSDLRVEPFREQTRVYRGSGANERVVISETLKGRVTEGQIAQAFAASPLLNIQGYAIALRALTLNGGANGSAFADLTLNLAGYRNAAGISPAPVALGGVALEPGGDFFAEIGDLKATALSTVSPAVAGLTLQGGTLIADFSTTRDFTGRDGLPIARDAGVFLMGGSAKLDAATLFPVTGAQQIQLAYDAIELRSDGYDGRFSVSGSDDITPVVPADYRLHFTNGGLAIAHGSLQPASITLDGVTELPSSVRSAAGGISMVSFTGMRRNNTFLIGGAETPELEWGAFRGTAFRLLNASGELRLPYGAATDWRKAGLHLTRGTVDAPIRSKGEIGITTAANMPTQTASTSTGAATSAKPKGNTAITSTQNQAQSNITASQVYAALAGNQFDLSVGTGGVNGTLKWAADFDGKIGDFKAAFNSVSFTFLDNAVTDSRLDGELVIPEPANFKLGFTEATMTGSGEVVGPKLIAPGEIALDYWRVKLVLPPPQSAGRNGAQGHVQLALADTSTKTDAPLMLAAAKGGAPAPNTTLPNTSIVTKPASMVQTSSTVAAMVLSSSYLRINYPQMRFLLDPQYGPLEFDPMELQSIEIGADGQIKTSRLRLLRAMESDAKASRPG